MSTEQQGTHFYVLTLQKPAAGGMAVATWHGVITPWPGATRLDIYRWLIDDAVQKTPAMVGANTTFFALESNQL